MLHTFSSLQRVRNCFRCRHDTEKPVEIRHRADGRANFSNVQTCGSVWACPVCSMKILAKRVEELHRAIVTHRDGGGDVAMLTLTMRHRPGQSLDDLWEALAAAWRSASSGSRAVRVHWEGVEWVKRVEVTHGANGWHVHIHALLFHRGVDLAALETATFVAWSKALQRHGLDAPLRGPAIECRPLDVRASRRELAEYLAKGSYDANRDAALETVGPAKLGRHGNRTPFQILSAFVRTGEASDAELWREWERASHGRRAITWSRGTRERLVGGEEELSDEEAARQSDEAGRVVAIVRHPDTWQRICARPVLAQQLLAATELMGDREDVHEYLSVLCARAGLPGAIGPPPPAPVSELAA